MTHAQVNTLKRSASKKSKAKGATKTTGSAGGKKAGVSSQVKSRALPAPKSSELQLGGLNRELLRSFTEFMREEGLASFVFKSGEFEVELKFANADYVPSMPMQPSGAGNQAHHGSRGIETPTSFSPSEEKRPAPAVNTRVIKSPFVGTFYRCPAPGKPAFVEIGATVNNGDALCVLEAMKLMNEIEAEFRCKILKVLVEDASPVEYGEALFEVEPL